MNKEVSYPFGYGLSYSSFGYASESVKQTMEGVINMKVTVTNTGKRAGKEVVQVYISAPGTILDQPALELRAFSKTGLLEPGQSEELTFSIEPKDYASYDTDRSSWIVEQGTFEVKVGASSSDIRTSETFDIPEEIIVEVLSHALQPQVDIDELKGTELLISIIAC